MATPIVAVSDSVFPNLDLAKGALAGVNAELRLAAEPTPEAIMEVAAEADGLLVTYAKVTGEMIAEMKNCKVIARFGIGVDSVDVEAATKAGIVVTYVPDYCIDEVSDHAMALLLTLARKTALASNLVHAGRWEMPAVVPLNRIRGRTLGLVGFGNIPQAVAPKAQAFGLQVITSDPFIPDEVVQKAGVEKVEFDELLARSDFVSVHAPLLPDTHHLFSTDNFAKMKSDALLINTARGPLVDNEALAKALDEGQIGGAGLDVTDPEPPAADSTLFGRDNVILTPHTAFYSVEALDELQVKAAKDVALVLGGERPVYPVNKEVLDN